MSTTFVIGDLHFGHEKILELETRPFPDIDMMDKVLIKNWNSVVGKSDMVYVLGDVSFHTKEKTKEIISKLNGKKSLIMGNHDRGRSIKWWSDVGFDEVSRYPIVYRDFTIMMHEPPQYYNNSTAFVYLYGHVHSSEMYQTVTKQTACVCCERWNYAPVPIETIYNIMKTK